MSSLDDAGKLLWEEMKPKIKAKKLKQKEDNAQKSELAMQVIRKYQGY